MTSTATPFEVVQAPPTSAPRLRVPDGACDTHSHVFGPYDRYPPLQRSVYALPDASPDTHREMRRALGVTFGVLTQPAPYADDPSAMLDALRHSDGALRGVAVADEKVSDRTLENWRAAGIVGLRFVEMRAPSGERYPGSVGADALRALAPRMRKFGLHAQLWASAEYYEAALPELLQLELPLVLDHMGCPNLAGGVRARSFQTLLDAVRGGGVWVKLAIRVASGGALDAVRPFHDALVEVKPDRLLWGSDWPFVRASSTLDAGKLLDRFDEWIDASDLRTCILTDNPAALYGFPRSTK